MEASGARGIAKHFVSLTSLKIATGRAAVTGGNEHADALRGRLLEGLKVERVSASTFDLFASTVTDAHDIGEIVLDDVFDGVGNAINQERGGANDELDGRIGGDAAGNFDVQIGFAIVARLSSIVLAGVNEDGVVDREIEKLPIGLHIAHQNVGPPDDGDGGRFR